MKKNKIGIIGMGNMGQAICSAIQKIISTDNIFITDLNISKLKICSDVQICNNSIEVVKNSDIIFLAVKPDKLDEIANQLSNLLEKKIIISVLAGISLEHLEKTLKCKMIIRAMPNLCIKVKKGVIGWIASKFISAQKKQIIIKLFSVLGFNFEVEEENKIDAITAIAGSGPAYFFYLTEILIQKAIEFGFTDIQAKNIAEMTFIGASHLLQSEQISAKEWKDRVTSKKGTTEAALDYLKKHFFDQIFKNGIQQAFNKAEELSDHD